MRRLMVTVLASAVALLGLAGAANAVSFSLVWSGTTGTGATGSSDIGVGVGDTLTLDVFLNYGASGLSLAAVSFGWDPALLSFSTLVSGAECPQPPNPAPSTCTGGAVLSFTSLAPIVSGVTVAGNTAGSLDAGTGGAALVGPNFIALAQLVFTATGFGGTPAVSLFYGGPDGIVDSAGNLVADANNPIGLDTASVSGAVIPEPGTAALLGLGLGTLAIAGRRRTR